MDQKIDLTGGGLAYVMVGHTGMVKEYANNPQVKFIDCKATPGTLLIDLINQSLMKVAILTEGIPKEHYIFMTTACNRRKVPFLIRKSNQAIYETLKSFFPNGEPVKATLAEVKETQERGKLKQLIPFIDWAKSNSENARILMNKAVELGIKTTLGSVTQSVSIERRRQGRTDVPKSVRSKLDLSVEMFDKFIEDASAMRDYVIELADENRTLKMKLDKYKKAMEALNE